MVMLKLGILAALGDKRLSIAVTAMHDHPNVDWTLETLAEKAGMSRARFASHFRSVTDTTPLEYLTAWRIELTKNQLRQGRSLKVIAPKVGYGSAEALIRSFTRHTHTLRPKSGCACKKSDFVNTFCDKDTRFLKLCQQCE
jgi:AraC-like DNA-binding protein